MTANEIANRFFEIGVELGYVAAQLTTLELVVVPRKEAFPDDLPTDEIFQHGWRGITKHVERLSNEFYDRGPDLEKLGDLASEIASVSDVLCHWAPLTDVSVPVPALHSGWEDALWSIERHLERISDDVSRMGFVKGEKVDV